MAQCDSHYFLIDHDVQPEGREDDARVRHVLALLMDQWWRAVAALGDGGVCYLPYDFSDQYTGWLRCEAGGRDLKVHAAGAEFPVIRSCPPTWASS